MRKNIIVIGIGSPQYHALVRQQIEVPIIIAPQTPKPWLRQKKGRAKQY